MALATSWAWFALPMFAAVAVSAAAMDERELRDAAVQGHPAALRELVSMLTPVVQSRVARALLAGGRTSHQRNIREEVRDLAQEIFAVLFADGGKVLRAWDPERGVSLKGFVGVVATRRAVSMVRTSKRNPWTEDPTDSADLDLIQSSRRDADRAVIAKEILSKGMAAVRGDLSERGQQLFDLIIVEDASNEEVAEATGLSRDAIYQWRSRLMKALRQQLRKIDPSSP